MLKQYTKYVATAFAVASLSTSIIGCGAEEAAIEPSDGEIKLPDGTNDPTGNTEEMPAPTPNPTG
jgi:hypothetical protein